jgi:N-acetylneuraminic acid mutarotase
VLVWRYNLGSCLTFLQGKLFVFGGEKEDQTIVNTLSVFDTNSSKWSPLKSSPQAVTGHTATLVGDKMIVIFGLSTEGLFPGVQEYHIGKIVLPHRD